MAILICVATSEELSALFPETSLPASMTHEQTLFSASKICTTRQDLYTCVTGTGPINAACALGSALTALKLSRIPCTLVLATGLCGAYDLERVPLKTCCLIHEEIFPEYGLHDGHAVVAEAFKWPQWKESPKGMIYDRISLCEKSFLETLGVSAKKMDTFLPCASLTVAGVSASFARAEFLWNTYHAALENMEGFSLALTALRFAVPCLEIRCVSNKVGPRRPDQKDFPGALQTLGELLPTLNLL